MCFDNRTRTAGAKRWRGMVRRHTGERAKQILFVILIFACERTSQMPFVILASFPAATSPPDSSFDFLASSLSLLLCSFPACECLLLQLPSLAATLPSQLVSKFSMPDVCHVHRHALGRKQKGSFSACMLSVEELRTRQLTSVCGRSLSSCIARKVRKRISGLAGGQEELS